MRGPLVPAAVAVLLIAGCLGSGDEPLSTGSVQRPAPVVDAETGAVEGVVTDNAVAPVPGATIALVGTGLETRTHPDGSFVINGVLPGAYTVTATREGMVPASTTVTVRSNAVATVDFVLVHLVSETAYVEERELAGFMACGIATGYNATSLLPAPPEPVPDVREEGIVSWTICEDVDFATGNSTADESYWEVVFDPPLHSLVYEIVWEAANPIAEEMLGFGGFGLTHDQVSRWQMETVYVAGPSPLLSRLDRTDLEQIQTDFTTACEGGDDAFCGHNFMDSGWDFGTAVLPNQHCAPHVVSVCGAFQQTFTLYLSAFYNAQAPGGWSILERA